MEIIEHFWKIFLHTLWYALWVGGIPMIMAIIRDHQEDKKRKQRRRKHEENTGNEAQRAG